MLGIRLCLIVKGVSERTNEKEEDGTFNFRQVVGTAASCMGQTEEKIAMIFTPQSFGKKEKRESLLSFCEKHLLSWV